MADYENMQERSLIGRIVAGKEDAFDYIFRKYYRALCANAIVLLKDDDLAQSVVQDCFIQFWEKRRELKDVKKMYPFLSVMVRNKAIDSLRKEDSEKRIVNVLKDRIQDNTVENSAVLAEYDQIFNDAVLKLPERCKMAFEYSRFEGLKYSEIAAEMNISQKAVESLIGRALKILRVELKDYLPVIWFILFFIKKS
jgi:RNA polymerase sigma-70 factor (ECF subfamily)